jgi:2-polyprenyl-3-methyl-5-hydroxy-6-metoxy-1,4-benzoquinol methylase
MSTLKHTWDSEAVNWTAKYQAKKGRYNTRAEITAHLIERRCPPGRFLDYGCGEGSLVANMASRGYEAYGCDLSPEMLRYAQKNSQKTGVPSDRFRVNEENDVPFQGRFDAISIRGVYPYINDYDVFTQRIGEKLRDGGIVVASCTNRVSFYTYCGILQSIFRISNYKSWLASNYALIRTGTWSGCGVNWRDQDKIKRCYSAESFDAMFLRNSFRYLEAVDLFNLSLLDKGCMRRSPVGQQIARRFAWSHLAVYEKVNR